MTSIDLVTEINRRNEMRQQSRAPSPLPKLGRQYHDHSPLFAVNHDHLATLPSTTSDTTGDTASRVPFMAPLRRTVTIESSALDADDESPVRVPGVGAGGTVRAQPRRPSGTRRVSLNSTLPHRPSIVGRPKNMLIDEEAASISSPKPERPAIPSALQPPPEVYTTPLPILSMIVLSIVRAFSVIKVCFPDRQSSDHARRVSVRECISTFLVVHGREYANFFPLSALGFNTLPGFEQFENEADVGKWTGILGAIIPHWIEYLLMFSPSFDILSHTVPDLVALGM